MIERRSYIAGIPNSLGRVPGYISNNPSFYFNPKVIVGRVIGKRKVLFDKIFDNAGVADEVRVLCSLLSNSGN